MTAPARLASGPWCTPLAPSTTGASGHRGCGPRCSAPTTASCRPPHSWSASRPPAARRTDVLIAGIAAIVAGALSMAVGEYVSVSSQRDAEEADLAIEAEALRRAPARRAPRARAHLRGTRRRARARAPRRRNSSWRRTSSARTRATSSASPTSPPRARAGRVDLGGGVHRGAIWPVLAVFAPTSIRVGAIAVVTLVALAVLGAVGAALGGAPRGRGALRTLVLSSTALLISYRSDARRQRRSASPCSATQSMRRTRRGSAPSCGRTPRPGA